MTKQNILKEIERAEGLLANEKNLDKVSFYEGYIKGLKFFSQKLDEYREEIRKQVVPEIDEEELEIGCVCGRCGTIREINRNFDNLK